MLGIKMRFFLLCLTCLTVLLTQVELSAQSESDERALIKVKNGISISQDSLFLLNLRFRMQNRIGLTSVSGDDLHISQVEARVRRMRLRLDGYVLNQRMQYYVQLAFSKADQDLEVGTISQIVRDAILYYHFTPNFYMGFGQSKLPGNRQRVISSGQQQFADRSIVNAALTLDRDFGVFAYYTLPLGETRLIFKTAITSGDGRNASVINDGLAYTGRLEFLPFGNFTNGGDYSEGDLEREKMPKVSVAAGYSFNHKSSRTGGQLGSDLYQFRDFGTFTADFLFKYLGWAYSIEFMDRSSADPLTFSSTGAVRYIYTGSGLNQQISYCFPNKVEVAARYSQLWPGQQLHGYERRTDEVWLGGGKYFNGHRIKAQMHLSYRWRDGVLAADHNGNRWGTIFQVEFGI
jgi:hypothetical protein